jgi:hypothetical protein
MFGLKGLGGGIRQKNKKYSAAHRHIIELKAKSMCGAFVYGKAVNLP